MLNRAGCVVPFVSKVINYYLYVFCSSIEGTAYAPLFIFSCCLIVYRTKKAARN